MRWIVPAALAGCAGVRLVDDQALTQLVAISPDL